METTVINIERELKDFISQNRKNITNINGVQFGEMYPIIDVTNKHTSYYDVESQEYKFLYAPFTIEYKLDDIINENNHPSLNDIIGKSKEELLNRRPYIVAAIEAWKENRYDATPDRVAYNINYFEVELQIIDKELKTK